LDLLITAPLGSATAINPSDFFDFSGSSGSEFTILSHDTS
jgi:hypothetical protein